MKATIALLASTMALTTATQSLAKAAPEIAMKDVVIDLSNPPFVSCLETEIGKHLPHTLTRYITEDKRNETYRPWGDLLQIRQRGLKEIHNVSVTFNDIESDDVMSAAVSPDIHVSITSLTSDNVIWPRTIVASDSPHKSPQNYYFSSFSWDGSNTIKDIGNAYNDASSDEKKHVIALHEKLMEGALSCQTHARRFTYE